MRVFCIHCGAANNAAETRCVVCGKGLLPATQGSTGYPGGSSTDVPPAGRHAAAFPSPLDPAPYPDLLAPGGLSAPGEPYQAYDPARPYPGSAGQPWYGAGYPAPINWGSEDLTLPAHGPGSAADALPRLGAFVFDLMIYGMIAVILMTISEALGIATFGTLLALALHPIYHIGFWSTTGQTPGYRAAGLQMISTRGTKPTVASAVVRYFGMQISQWALYLGCLWMLWDRRKQTWHDKMAGTLVIRA